MYILYCKYCGQQLSEDSRFCKKCGKPVQGPILDSQSRPALTGYAVIWPTLMTGLAAAAFILYLISSVTVGSFAGDRTYHLVLPDSWPPILWDVAGSVEWAKAFALFAMVLMLIMVIRGAVKRQKPYCFWGTLAATYTFVGIMMLVLGLLQEVGGGLYEVTGQPIAMTLSALLFCALLILSVFSPKGIKHLSKGWLVPTAIFVAVSSVLGQISGSLYNGSLSPLILLSLLCSAAMAAAVSTKKYIACILTAVISAALQCAGNLELLLESGDLQAKIIMIYEVFPVLSILACIIAAVLAFTAYQRREIQPGVPVVPLETESSPPAAPRRFPGMLILTVLLSMLFSDRMLHALLWDRPMGALSLIRALVMFAVLIVLCAKGRILPGKLRANALFYPGSMLLLGLIKIFFFVMLASLMSQYIGVNPNTPLISRMAATELYWGIGPAWQWGILILFLLLRSGTLRLRRSSLTILTVSITAILLVWSMLMLLFPKETWLMYDTPSWIVYIAHSSTLWIRSLTVYLFVLLAGTGRLSDLSIMLFPVVIGMSAFSLLMFAIILMQHIYLAAYTLTAGYLIGLLFLLINYLSKARPRTGPAGD